MHQFRIHTQRMPRIGQRQHAALVQEHVPAEARNGANLLPRKQIDLAFSDAPQQLGVIGKVDEPSTATPPGSSRTPESRSLKQ